MSKRFTSLVILLLVALSSSDLVQSRLLHSHAVIVTPNLPRLAEFTEVDKFIEYDLKLFDDVQVEFRTDDSIEPWVELRNPANEVVSMFDLSTLSLEEIRTVLLQMELRPRDALKDVREIETLYKEVGLD